MKSLRASSRTPVSQRARRKRPTALPARPLGRGSNRLVSTAKSFAARIATFELSSQAAADLAAQWRLEIDAQERKVVEWFAPAKQSAFRAHAAICRQENEALTPYHEARRVLNAKLSVWHDQGHRSGPTGALQLEGDPSASNLQSQTIGEANAADEPPRADGVSFRDNWRNAVIDKLAFVAAVASKPELVNLIEPNMAALAHLARAHKGALSIPGVRVWCERTVVASRRL